MSQEPCGKLDGPGCSADCEHGRSHIVDSKFFGHAYSTPESRRIFCDTGRIGRWLKVESALATAQAQLGIIPEWAASKIVAACRLDDVDLERVREGIRETGHSLVPLLRELSRACGPAFDFVHFGATTQDIQDSAQALEIREALACMEAHLNELVLMLARLAESHSGTLMVGRTHAQAALPTTFGLKVAGWVDELARSQARLHEIAARVLVAQLFGGVGTMAAFGPRALELLEAFAARLGLGVPLVGWHSSRDRISEYVCAAAMMTATLARIADEIRTLSRPEFAELEPSWSAEQVGSSTMPHKRNPEGCEQVVVLARLARAQAAIALEGMVVDHERDYRGVRLEWCAVADVSHYALTGLAFLEDAVRGLRVHTDRMAERVYGLGDQLCSEALMMAIARRVGRERAHAIVSHLSRRTRDLGIPLRRAIAESSELVDLIDEATLERVLDPGQYLGESNLLVARVLARLTRRPSGTLAKTALAARSPAADERSNPRQGEVM